MIEIISHNNEINSNSHEIDKYDNYDSNHKKDYNNIKSCNIDNNNDNDTSNYHMKTIEERRRKVNLYASKLTKATTIVI